MPWNATSPDGSKSVKQNTSPMQENTTYIKTTMNKDHYWDIGADEDGHHKFMQTVATNDADKSLATNATIATGMDLVYYSRFKTPSEAIASAAQNCQPFALESASAVMQLLGMRACVLFRISAGSTTIRYAHNIASINYQAAGRYEIFFTNNLPSNDYLVIGGASLNSGSPDFIPAIAGATSQSTYGQFKTENRCICLVANNAGTLVDPLEAWFIFFGG